MGKFVIKQNSGNYRFSLKANNGEVILSSESYTSKAGCENGIKSVKTNAASDDRYDRKTASNGKYYFNLKARNGEIIGSSEMYESSSGRDKGIESVKANAPDAEVVEE